jgi:crotonobetainyl-CoA:carnitine CoA-transferase CaiB-like acyl-CoA transferase
MPDPAAIDRDSSAPPLAGIRVLELGSTVAGPFCGRLLADFGADVVKVEPPGGDPVRSMGKRVGDVSLYAASIFRNKSLVCIDLREPAGRELVRALVRQADVVIENFRPGALESWGLGYDVLAADNPGLVMVRISGFGQDGPYRNRAGYGVICEALSGLRHLTGDPDRPPSRTAVSMTDNITGLYAAFGTVLALLARARTGRGQCIDAALYECAFSLMEPWIPAFEKLGHVAGRSGSRLPESTPNNLYPTRDGRHIHVTAMADPVFRRLCAAMGRRELADDPRFAGAVERSAHHEAIDGIVADWTGSRDLADLEGVLARADVPAMRIYTLADIFADPHYRARGSIAEAPHESLGSVAMAQVVPRLSATPGGIRHAGGAIGGATREVLGGRLGLDAAALDALAAAGVIATAEAGRPAATGGDA